MNPLRNKNESATCSKISLASKSDYPVEKVFRSHLPLTVLFVIAVFVNAYLMLHHELWRDEAQAWLIARNTTPVSLFKDVLSYEGHPFLWYAILMPFAKLGFPYITLSLISFGIMTCTIGIIVIHAPFDDLIKGLFIISPYCLFYFSTIARSYCLAALFITLLAWLYKDRMQRPILYCVIVSLMIQTHIVLIGFAFGLCLELFICSCFESSRKKTILKINFLSLLLPLGSALLYFVEFYDVQHSATISSVNIVLTIPSIWYHLRTAFDRILINWKAVVLLPVSLIAIRRKHLVTPVVVVIIAIVTQSLIFNTSNHRELLFGYYMLWLLWVLFDDAKLNRPESSLSLTAAKCSIYILLILSVFSTYPKYAGMFADIDGLFTDARNVAEYMDGHLSDAVVFESTQECCNAVVPYLKKAHLQDPFRQSEASYVTWNTSEITALSFQDLIRMVHTLFPDETEFYLLCPVITNQSLCYISDIPDGIDTIYTTDTDLCSDSLEYFNILRIPLSGDEGSPDAL